MPLVRAVTSSTLMAGLGTLAWIGLGYASGSSLMFLAPGVGLLAGYGLNSCMRRVPGPMQRVPCALMAAGAAAVGSWGVTTLSAFEQAADRADLTEDEAVRAMASTLDASPKGDAMTRAHMILAGMSVEERSRFEASHTTPFSMGDVLRDAASQTGRRLVGFDACWIGAAAAASWLATTRKQAKINQRRRNTDVTTNRAAAHARTMVDDDANRPTAMPEITAPNAKFLHPALRVARPAEEAPNLAAKPAAGTRPPNPGGGRRAA